MNKKVITLVLAGAMAAGLSTTAMADLRLVNGKIEVDAALKSLAAAYEEETGVHVEIESMGGGINIQDTLKGYYQADNMPDIFVNGGDADFANWEGLLADMSGEAWVQDTAAAYVDANGAVIGFPYTTEAIGLAYNADILEKAGIDPAELTGPEALKAAFETLDAQKEEYLDSGLDRDDTTYSDLLADGGQIDVDRFTHYAEMVDLFNQYSDPALLVSGTYDQQVLGFAGGKYAFVTQGSWIGATMTSDDADAYAEAGNFTVGMAPYAFEDGIDTILTNSPSWWSVFQNDNTEEALAFLQWCAEDGGQKFLVEDAGFISPFASCAYVANDPFAQTISDYTAAGKTSSWHWLLNKSGLDQNVLGSIYNAFAQGAMDVQGFVDTVQQSLAQYYAE